MVIIATSAKEVTARVTTFRKRCVVSPLTKLVSVPLFMLHKFTGSNCGNAYGATTFTQLGQAALFIRTFVEYFVLKSYVFHHFFDEKRHFILCRDGSPLLTQRHFLCQEHHAQLVAALKVEESKLEPTSTVGTGETRVELCRRSVLTEVERVRTRCRSA